VINTTVNNFINIAMSYVEGNYEKGSRTRRFKAPQCPNTALIGPFSEKGSPPGKEAA
jgi:hypothetical protein